MAETESLGILDDAALNLEGALHDLLHQFDPDDGGVCARTIKRVIGQISAAKVALEEIETFGYANSGHGFSCARMASKALGREPR